MSARIDMYVLGVDPGVVKHGYALLSVRGNVFSWSVWGHFSDGDFDQDTPKNWALAAVEKPTYQGPARTQRTILDVSFRAGELTERYNAVAFTPGEWKKILFRKASGVTESMVAGFVESKLGPLDVPKSKRVHIYDAACLAMAVWEDML